MEKMINNRLINNKLNGIKYRVRPVYISNPNEENTKREFYKLLWEIFLRNKR